MTRSAVGVQAGVGSVKRNYTESENAENENGRSTRKQERGFQENLQMQKENTGAKQLKSTTEKK